MPNVLVPGQKPDQVKSVLPMVGSVVGGVFGGAPGAAAGGQIGGMAGKQNPGPGAVDSQVSAIDRRISTQQDNPSTQLAQADAALKTLPPEYQQKYGPAIQQARQLNSQEGYT